MKNHFAACDLKQNLPTSTHKKIGPPAFLNGGRDFSDLLFDIWLEIVEFYYYLYIWLYELQLYLK